MYSACAKSLCASLDLCSARKYEKEEKTRIGGNEQLMPHKSERPITNPQDLGTAPIRKSTYAIII